MYYLFESTQAGERSRGRETLKHTLPEYKARLGLGLETAGSRPGSKRRAGRSADGAAQVPRTIVCSRTFASS